MLGLHPLNSLFGAVKNDEYVDLSAYNAYLSSLATVGMHMFFTYPGAKNPWDLRTPKQKKDQAEAWENMDPDSRPCSKDNLSGVHMATDNATILRNWAKSAVKQRGHDPASGNLIPVEDVPNIAVNLGTSRCVVVDCDTADELQAFRSWAAEVSGDNRWSWVEPTVTSPGTMDDQGNWKHSNGGHFWFTLPGFGVSDKKRQNRTAERQRAIESGKRLTEQQVAEQQADAFSLDMKALKGSIRIHHGDSSFVVMLHSHYVLIPPSHRKEGWYTAKGPAFDMPQWFMSELYGWTAQARQDRAARAERLTRQGLPAEALDELHDWYAETPWADFLLPHGWEQTGTDSSCGCPVWGRPGNRSSDKSATAHQVGCAMENYADSPDPPIMFWTDNPGAEIEAKLADVGGKTLSKLQLLAAFDYDGSDSEALRHVVSGDVLRGESYQQFIAPGIATPAPAGATEDIGTPAPYPESSAAGSYGGSSYGGGYNQNGAPAAGPSVPTAGATAAGAAYPNQPYTAASEAVPTYADGTPMPTYPAPASPAQPAAPAGGSSIFGVPGPIPTDPGTTATTSAPYTPPPVPAVPSMAPGIGDSDDDDSSETLGLGGVTRGEAVPQFTVSAGINNHVPEFYSLRTVPLEPVSFLIDGWIQRGAVSAIVGPPNAGKSAVVLDMLCNIAAEPPQGTQHGKWRHRFCHHQKVLYIAGEGAAGVAQRVRTWEKIHNRSVGDNFHMTTEGFKLGSSEEAWVRLWRKIVDNNYDVVVFDTLATMMSGLEENSADDMGRVLTALQTLCNTGGRIIDPATNKRQPLSVLLIHHTAKNSETFSPRGSSALTGAVASQILVRKQEPDEIDKELLTTLESNSAVPIEVSVTKQKEGAYPPPMSLTLVGCDVPEDIGGTTHDEFGQKKATTAVLVGWSDGSVDTGDLGSVEREAPRINRISEVQDLEKKIIKYIVANNTGAMARMVSPFNTISGLRKVFYDQLGVYHGLTRSEMDASVDTAMRRLAHAKVIRFTNRSTFQIHLSNSELENAVPSEVVDRLCARLDRYLDNTHDADDPLSEDADKELYDGPAVYATPEPPNTEGH